MDLKPYLGAYAGVILTAGAALASDAASTQQSSAEAPVGVYATGSSENYCPAGLQPVTVDGTTSCGTPNRAGTYAQAMRAPAGRSRAGWYSCPVGTKGCY